MRRGPKRSLGHSSINEADQTAQVMSLKIRKALGISEDQIQALLRAELR